jgi:hypothetical protein
VVNKTIRNIPLTIKIEDNSGTIQVAGKEVIVQSEGQGSGSFFVILPKKLITERKTIVKLGLYQGNKKITDMKTSFLGPIFSND